MSPFSQLVSFGTKRPPGVKSLHAMSVVAAGRVTVSSQDSTQAPGVQLRLLYAGAKEDHGLRHELSRRRVVSELEEGLLMPEGKVLAALWDPSLERYTALSRPFEVARGRTVAAPLQRPGASESHLVVYVDRAEGTVATDVQGLALWVSQGGTERRADLQIVTPWGAYGAWYGLPPGRARLGGGSDRLYLEGETLELAGGRIERFQGKLTRRPFLNDEEP
jgi:hypothetical protein